MPGQRSSATPVTAKWLCSTWDVKISWGYHDLTGIYNNRYTIGYAPDGNPNCTVPYANGVSISLHGPCTWYGQIPAFTASQGFGATENFTVHLIYNGVPIATDHFINGELRGDGLVCYSTDDDAGHCS